jgi:hypothetical protein
LIRAGEGDGYLRPPERVGTAGSMFKTSRRVTF